MHASTFQGSLTLHMFQGQWLTKRCDSTQTLASLFLIRRHMGYDNSVPNSADSRLLGTFVEFMEKYSLLFSGMRTRSRFFGRDLRGKGRGGGGRAGET